MKRRALRFDRFAWVLLPLGGIGCSQALVGTWKIEPVPENEPYYISRMTFKDDGKYTAIARQEGQPDTLEGTFEFNGFQLNLKTPGKAARSYGAALIVGGKLELKSDGKKFSYEKL